MRKIKDILSRRPIFFGALFLVPFFAIYACFIYTAPALPFYDGESVVLTGRICEKTVSENGDVDSLCVKGEYGFKCYVNEFELSSAIPLGSVVLVNGTFKHFSSPTNPGEFDGARFYENRGYLFYLNVNDISVVSSPKFPVKEYFFKMRLHCIEIVKRSCPLESGTINTLLFGDRTGLDPKRQNSYKRAGLAHFLVISGLHMSVAGGGVYTLLKRFGMKRSRAAVMGMGFILFYGSLAGFSVSVLRAVIMHLFRLTADVINRSYDILSALGVASTVTLISNPLQLRDSSFLYSYTAVLVIGLYFSYVHRDLQIEIFGNVYSKDGSEFRSATRTEAAVIPLIVYLALLPISLYFQSYSNLLSVPLNLCLGLLTGPVIMLAALGFMFGGIKLYFFAALADFFCALLLKVADGLSHVMSTCHFAYIANKPGLSIIFLYYVAFGIIFLQRKRMPGKCAAVVVMSTAISLLSLNPSPYPSLAVLDVDQGDCIVLRTGKHSAIISDCGSTGRSEVGKNVLYPYLLSQGITTVEDIFISHSDSDHINGISYLLENSRTGPIKVKRVVFPYLPKEMWDEKFEEIYELALKNRVKVSAVKKGDELNYGKIRVKVLNPSPGRISEDPNTDSTVLWASVGDTDILLTGDATEETEKRLALPDNVCFEILKVAHHGSRFSSSGMFLQEVTPALSLISAGKNNRYGHPHNETIKRLENVGSVIYQTGQSGAITVYLGKKKLKVRHYCK